MKKLIVISGLSLAALAGAALAASEGGHHGPAIERLHWPFAGLTGQYDRQQLQRGFQIFSQSCSACHGLKRVAFRNLVEPGGPEFPEKAVAALAASWPHKIVDGPNDEGKMIERAAKPSDPIVGPYKNDNEARAAQNGALPPDLSNITKARAVENHSGWIKHVLWDMPRDVVTGYQEGGADYLHALLTGYKDAPADVTVSDGMFYNTAFPGHQLAMPPPLSADNVIEYQEGAGAKASLDQNVRDVTAFLAWAADPQLNTRKQIGWQVMLYLIITTLLLYFAKKRLWSHVGH